MTLDVKLETTGDAPAIGSLVTYTFTISNNTSSPVDHIAVWDTLPSGMVFESNGSEIVPSQAGSYIFWDVTNDSHGLPFILNPGKQMTITFTTKIESVNTALLPLTNTIMTDYNDPYYVPAMGKHPAISSALSYYPIGDPVVFPNPFNLDTNHKVTFDNVVPGSLIEIFTLSGEDVKTINMTSKEGTWDGKNRNGSVVSPGVYFFAIKNQATGDFKTGKLFVVRGN